MFDEDRVITLLAAGVAIPPDQANILIKGIKDVKSGVHKTLCRALGMRRPGQSSPETRAKLKRRNEVIRSIARVYGAHYDNIPVRIAERLKSWPYRIPTEEKPLYAVLHSIDPDNPKFIPKSTQSIRNILAEKQIK